ncbi:hypothetical protein BKA70DRAFT_1242587 [Coprinopsis sp. MPI-PUGE-AT-0042]|nr:hypothetical protein BKA70DRAFT_1242587 [Coprinopsis sp. MPI-PUGE-AT-0042]
MLDFFQLNRGFLDAQRASSALWGDYFNKACLSLHALIQFWNLPPQQQTERGCYLWFLGALLLLSTIFSLVWVIQGGVPEIDLSYYGRAVLTCESSKWSTIVAVSTSVLELFGGAFMNSFLKPILYATYTVFLGVCIASLFFQTKALTDVGKAEASIQKAHHEICRGDSYAVCKGQAESWFLAQAPMVNPTVNLSNSYYLNKVHHICTKESLLDYPVPILHEGFPRADMNHGSNGSAADVLVDLSLMTGMNSGTNGSAAAAPACHSLLEMRFLQYEFAAELIKPIQDAHRWWRKVEFVGSVGVSIVCTALIGVRPVSMNGFAGGSPRSCSFCKSGSSLALVAVISMLIESGLPSTMVGVFGIPIRTRKHSLAPPFGDNFLNLPTIHPGTQLNHIIHTLWLHTLFGSRVVKLTRATKKALWFSKRIWYRENHKAVSKPTWPILGIKPSSPWQRPVVTAAFEGVGRPTLVDFVAIMASLGVRGMSLPKSSRSKSWGETLTKLDGGKGSPSNGWIAPCLATPWWKACSKAVSRGGRDSRLSASLLRYFNAKLTKILLSGLNVDARVRESRQQLAEINASPQIAYVLTGEKTRESVGIIHGAQRWRFRSPS